MQEIHGPMELLIELKEAYVAYENAQSFNAEFNALYEPAKYMLSLGGKKMRPVMLLLANKMAGGHLEDALPAAFAIEIFHNFTLVHDDIMDDADKRRGNPSVHVKYNPNQAILSGDVMAIKAYQYVIDHYEPSLGFKLLGIFNKMATEVCEGQQLDMDFETMDDVEIPEYFKMIELKTSVLIAAAMQMGALIGGCSDDKAMHFYEYCKNAGIAFQVQDDILDTFGDEQKTGKKVGGDIANNKKTYLYLKSLELGSTQQKLDLKRLFTQNGISEEEKIRMVTDIYKDTHVIGFAKEVMAAYMQLSDSHAKSLQLGEEKEKLLMDFSNMLVQRDS